VVSVTSAEAESSAGKYEKIESDGGSEPDGAAFATKQEQEGWGESFYGHMTL
jgi:hypothetical protein